MLLGVVVAFASIYARRTRLGKTTEFWGSDTIRALQYSPRVLLKPELRKERPEDLSALEVVDLTGTPGLGHLRRALLDERHYDWNTRTSQSVASLAGDDAKLAELEFSDPRGFFPTATIQLELNAGWAGLADHADRVKFTDRVRPAVRHFLQTVSNAQQAHYDQRHSADE